MVQKNRVRRIVRKRRNKLVIFERPVKVHSRAHSNNSKFRFLSPVQPKSVFLGDRAVARAFMVGNANID